MDICRSILHVSSIIAAILCGTLRAADPVDDPAALGLLRTKFEEATATLDGPIKELDAKYLASLLKLQTKVRESGQLERTLTVAKEIETFASGESAPAGDFAELKRLQEVYHREKTRLKHLYARDFAPLAKTYRSRLEELKAELTRANQLPQAIAVEAEIERLNTQLSETVVLKEAIPEDRQGLRLRIAGEERVWQNDPVYLPGQTPIWFEGYVHLPEGATSLKLRSSNAYGSERLDFVIANLEVEVGTEGSHRFFSVEFSKTMEKVSVKIGKESVSNAWDWGVLQWSIDERPWKDIPAKNLSH